MGIRVFFSRDETTLQERLFVRLSVGPLVKLLLFDLRGKTHQGTEKSFQKAGVSLMAVSHLAGILNNRILNTKGKKSGPIALDCDFP